MAHEFRYGYGYLNGELMGGGNRLSDVNDELDFIKATTFMVGVLVWIFKRRFYNT